jgi:hypothetical protein
MTGDEGNRLTELRAQVAARLRPVCDGWPEDRFAGMVAQIAAITLKYELSGPKLALDDRTSDVLIDELRKFVRRSEQFRDK